MSLTVDLGKDVFSTHNFDAPVTSVETNKEELMGFMREMYTMRRMEITNDTEYKVCTPFCNCSSAACTFQRPWMSHLVESSLAVPIN
jgi:hypothetical protein